MNTSQKDQWSDRKRLQRKLKLGLKLSNHELSRAKEIGETIKLLQLLKTGEPIEEGQSSLRRCADRIICDVIFQIISLRKERMKAREIASCLLKADDHLIKSAGYSVILQKVRGEKVPVAKFIREVLDVTHNKPESLEKTVLRLLSKDSRFIKVKGNLFLLRDWPPEKLLQEYVRLASEYRLTDPEKKENFVQKAIGLLESGKVDYPNKNKLIQTLKKL